MRKLVLFSLLFSLLFSGCDEGCTDDKACNYGITTEACKYGDQEEAMLIGTWNLIDIHDSADDCVFSYSSDFDCELDELFESINIIFDNDKKCHIITTPSDYSDPVPVGNWSINICEHILVFAYSNSYDLYIYPHYLPFGHQRIIHLDSNSFMCEDLDGNTLHWEKI